RAVVLAKARGDAVFHDGDAVLLPALETVAVIAIEDEIRPDCRETIETFLANDMEIRILSGDDPAAVNALFTIAGLPGERKILSGDELERLSDSERTRRILETNIFGRMRPDHKELVVEELKKSGRYVAMIGDGVNDVRSLKEAQVGIALQSGSGAARSVADMVLVSDRFSALPKALTEGNRTVSAMRDILKVYIARNFVIAMMIFLIAVIFQAPPLVPITSAFYAFVSLSVASFFMVIWAKPSKLEGSVLPDVLRFAIPMAVLVSLFGLITYSLFYVGEYNGLFDVILTDDQLRLFWWAGGEHSGLDMTLFSDLEKTKMMAEIFGRNALLVFLMAAGLIQVMMVIPRFKFFSIDGRVNKDIKPTILVFLLFGLMALAYWAAWQYEIAAEVFCLYILPWYSYVMIAVMVIIWFFFSRWALRRGFLRSFTGFTERLYSMQLRSIRRKRDGQ
ncbi:MAG: HAD-IC family P-type ATPase, partial [Methanomassiliicoccaceae archaeon]|nr:HAD-IC family P-type ATPase [Methanomassiliicoccaceae archaeon]